MSANRPQGLPKPRAFPGGPGTAAPVAALILTLASLAALPAALASPAAARPGGSGSDPGGDAAADSIFDAADTFVFESASEEWRDVVMPAASEGTLYHPDLSFHRVDGWTLGARIGCRPPAGWLPRFDARVGIALGRDDRGVHALEIAQPVLPGRRLLLGWQVRRSADSQEGDAERVESWENFLSALLFRYDYRDYFEREGTSLFAEAAPLPWLAATLTYAHHDYSSLADSLPDASTVFRRDSRWRENPPIDEGSMKSVIVEAVVDRRDDRQAPRRGCWVRVQAEAAGPGLDSDFTFTRYQAEVRGYWPLAVGLGLKARALLGTTGAGTLPAQKQFAVGGIGTLRAHGYKHRRGDHVFLANAEGGFRLWRGRQRSGVRADVRLLAFADVGQAWQGPSYDVARRQMMADAGLGLELADGRLRLYAARDLRDAGSATLWTVRLASPF